MKRSKIIAAVITGALAVAGSAQAAGNHWCHQGDPAILASANTSCAFAGNAYSDWVNRGERTFYRGWSYSPATHKRYLITCHRTTRRDWWTQTVTCTGRNAIWFKSGMP